MDNTSIAQLQKQPVFIFSDITELFEVYSKDIRPRIKETGSLSIHQKASIAKPTLYIKTDKKIQIINNLELFYILKDPNLSRNLLTKPLSTVQINEAQFCIQYVFYELIENIVKYQKNLNIKSIYEQLNKYLNIDMKQKILGENNFHVTTFCKLIHLQEQTYYNRCKKRAKNANK